MTALFLTTIITCNQAIGIINRIEAKENLSKQIKNELSEEIKKIIPTCPIILKSDRK